MTAKVVSNTVASYVEIMKENSEKQEEAMLMDMMQQHAATLPTPEKFVF
jgi:hypothetical protein